MESAVATRRKGSVGVAALNETFNLLFEFAHADE
jgi:hypothetical protein